MSTARRFLPLVLAAVLSCLTCLAGPALGQEEILRPDVTHRVFYVECQGSVNSRLHFTGARLQIVVTHTTGVSLNPLSVVITSMPRLAERNGFYWNTDETSMQVLGTSLKCVIPNPGMHQSTLHFYYMSPALYTSKTGPTHREAERIKWVDTHAKPIKVLALQGEISMSFDADSVSGAIVMSGQDELARQPARYVATFQGREYVYSRPAP